MEVVGMQTSSLMEKWKMGLPKKLVKNEVCFFFFSLSNAGRFVILLVIFYFFLFTVNCFHVSTLLLPDSTF